MLDDEGGAEVAELQWKRMVEDMVKKGKLTNCTTICDSSGSSFKMGCFPIFKIKNKKLENTNNYMRRISPHEYSPTTLSQPPMPTRALQSPPARFKNRVESSYPTMKESSNGERAFSGPSSLHEHEALYSTREQSNKIRLGPVREHRPPPTPHPLPLPPAPRESGPTFRPMESFKFVNSSGPLSVPAPLPLPTSGTLRNFSYQEIVVACQDFSPERCLSEGLCADMYRASFRENNMRKLEATVARLHSSTEVLRNFLNRVDTLASVQHPNVCKLIGYHASDQRMFVYEGLFHGSLYRLLYGKWGGPTLDWNARTRVALCAAQGLAFFHEEGPFRVTFHNFSTANIQVDKDFNAKLSGYGCIDYMTESKIFNSALASIKHLRETLERGLPTFRTDVWSFGIVLLELLTGAKILDSHPPEEELKFVNWMKDFPSDDFRLSLIMDRRLQGQYPTRAARTVAKLAQMCLQMDPSQRPPMRKVVTNLRAIHDMKCSFLYPRKEPERVARKSMGNSPSLNGVKDPSQRPNLSPLSVMRELPPLPPSAPEIPRWRSSSILYLDEGDRQVNKRSSSSACGKIVVTVEGF